MTVDSTKARTTARSLAEMTPQERTECVGMWCEDIFRDLYVFLGHMPGGTILDEQTGQPMGAFIDTQEQDAIEAPLATFLPRFDLPRAWTPTGQPAKREMGEN